MGLGPSIDSPHCSLEKVFVSAISLFVPTVRLLYYDSQKMSPVTAKGPAN